jgi:hypothetical protein
MIKLKQLLLESTAPDIFVPRRMENRVDRYIKQYIRNGNKGNLDLNQMELIELPEILKDVSVSGYFNCAGNKLVDLKNSPKYVGGDFYCNYNKLTSLIGATSSVGGNFDCRFNKLTSLAGAPKKVGMFFKCNHNPVIFTEQQVRAVCDVKGKVIVW